MAGGWLKNLLDKLAKANEEQFGEEVPDCCKINADNNGAKAKPRPVEKRH